MRPAQLLLQRIEQIVAEMEPVTREVFLLHRVNSWSYARIAHDLGIGLEEVEQHLARAIAMLDQGLRREGF